MMVPMKYPFVKTFLTFMPAYLYFHNTDVKTCYETSLFTFQLAVR